MYASSGNSFNIPAEVDTFDDMRRWLQAIRDGDQATDQFYLGQWPALGDGRWYAQLNAIHAIQRPDDVGFMIQRRVASLSTEFRNDLHVRLFRVFASMGFDDHKWLTDDDLTQLVQFGDSEALDLEAESAHLGKAILKCGPQDEGKRKGLENECRRKDEKSHRIRTLLKAYVDEKKRRGL